MIGSYCILEIPKVELAASNGGEVIIENLKMMIESLNQEFISSLKDSLLNGEHEIELKLRIMSDSLMGEMAPIIPGMEIHIDRNKSLLRIDLLKEELE